jgi:hypothetical protein
MWSAPIFAQSSRSPADTGRMAWGHNDYSRYTSADPCNLAFMHVWEEYRRVYVPDTGRYAVARDTVPTAVLNAARECGSRFSVESIDPRELWSLMRISLVLEEDAKAKAAFERRYSLVTTPMERAATLVKGIQTYLQSAPPRLEMARELLRRIDSLGPSAKIAQYNARLAIMDYWHMVYDVDSLRAHANAAIERLQVMTQDERDAVDVTPPYEKLLLVANEQQDLDEQERLFDQALADVGGWREGRGSQWTGPMMSLLETRKAIYGKKTRALSGAFWFNHGGVPRPAPGKLSLIVHVSHLCSVRCYPLYAVVRQLHRQYGDELDITFVTDTRGFAPGTGPLSPEEEAKEAAKYFIDFLKFPVALLVDETPHTKRSDGRLVYKTSPIGEMFNGWQMVNAVLIDKEGRIRWLGALRNGMDKRMIESAITKAKNASSAETAASPAR